MILPPLNDTHCLRLVHQAAQEAAEHPAMVETVSALHAPAELAAFIRALPPPRSSVDAVDAPAAVRAHAFTSIAGNKK